ncbi:uncharacterized protein RCO7_11530 [Rhynchosporium graminicola]|uniref:Mid2 domain-containing protein n=1 Tax=Rhynchosporium graminicola TaxID=2792576 RepID=A0A1E1LDX3_9HELO|nr:uncharacterized protein RCO7_11530 [Rhynchosporium commune]
MAQSLIFETPSKFVRATIPVNITWNPQTFGASPTSNFSLSLWLLRSDSPDNDIVNSYLPEILAHNQSVFANLVVWTPRTDDVNVGVRQLGSDQLAWEKTNDNPELSPFLTKFKGFSRGFTVQPPLSDPSLSSSVVSSSSPSSSSSSSSGPSSTSLITSTTSTTLGTTSTAALESSTSDAAKTSTTNLPVALGLSIGLGLLALICVSATIWGVRRYRRLKSAAVVGQPQDTYISAEPSNYYKGELAGSRMTEAVEMSSEKYNR